jgi:hypothetical protein
MVYLTWPLKTPADEPCNINSTTKDPSPGASQDLIIYNEKRKKKKEKRNQSSYIKSYSATICPTSNVSQQRFCPTPRTPDAHSFTTT